MIYKRLTDVLAGYWGKWWGELPEEQRQAWHEALGGALGGTRESDGKLWDGQDAKGRKYVAEGYDNAHDPSLEGERFVGKHDYSMNARMWFDMPDVEPRDAAMVLCRYNPNRGDPDYYVDDDELSPERYRLLLAMFESVARALPKHRTLMEWRVIAQEKGLRYHEWVDMYVQARGEELPADSVSEGDAAEVGAGGTAEKEHMTQAASVPNACADFLALPNLSANEVSIEFAAGDSGGVILNVMARNVTRRITLAELDLFDRRKGEMNNQGGLLLGLAQGRRIHTASQKTAKQIGRLRKALKTRLGIKDDPIHQNNAGYSPAFKLTDNRGAADARAKREGEWRKESLEELQERGVQLGDDERTDYSYETDEDMAGDAADEFLKAKSR